MLSIASVGRRLRGRPVLSTVETGATAVTWSLVAMV
jgi:hypothetical protein